MALADASGKRPCPANVWANVLTDITNPFVVPKPVNEILFAALAVTEPLEYGQSTVIPLTLQVAKDLAGTPSTIIVSAKTDDAESNTIPKSLNM